MICAKSYQDIPPDPKYENWVDENELYEDWLEDWEDEHGKADGDTQEILWQFFDKVVYHDYYEGNTNCSDWSLEEIKDKLLEWYIKNYHEMETQFGNLIREVQRNNLINKSEESEVLKKSRLVYINQTGSCI